MESTPDQVAEGKAVVAVLAAVLERLVSSNLCNDNASNPANGEHITKFHALKAPCISIKQYLERIHKYASCSTECFILALIYIDRLIQRNNFILSELNVHRVVITAVLLAAKFFDDAYYNNAYYAKVGGVLVSEMNGLEVEFLFRINFWLHVTPEIFVKYQDELVSHAIGAGLENPKQHMGDVSKLPPCPQPAPAAPAFVPVPVRTPNQNPTAIQSWNDAGQDTNRNQCQVPTSTSNQTWNDAGQDTNRNQCPVNFEVKPTLDYPLRAVQNQNTNQRQTHLKRHITPSPPHNFQGTMSVSPAKSAPSDLFVSRSNSECNQGSEYDLHDEYRQFDIAKRPRNNSFPMVAPTADPTQNNVRHPVLENQQQHHQQLQQFTYYPNHQTSDGNHTRPAPISYAPVDLIACNHYGLHNKPSSPFVNVHAPTARSVYQ